MTLIYVAVVLVVIAVAVAALYFRRRTTKRITPTNLGWIGLVSGLVFVVAGLVVDAEPWQPIFFGVLGVAMVAYSVFLFVYDRRRTAHED